jgi:hypothetical protein
VGSMSNANKEAYLRSSLKRAKKACTECRQQKVSLCVLNAGVHGLLQVFLHD